jgi:hypothetical protein
MSKQSLCKVKGIKLFKIMSKLTLQQEIHTGHKTGGIHTIWANMKLNKKKNWNLSWQKGMVRWERLIL